MPLPPAASLQWEVELEGGSDGVERVEVAYREVNLAPRLEAVEVEEPGVIYLPAPPPSGPVIDIAHPDLAGIFSVIDEKPSEERKPKQGKKYWRVGFRTLSWKGDDPNGDPLRYAVELERDDGFRLPVRERLETTELAVDTTAAPDGIYRFRISASDEVANPGAAEDGGRPEPVVRGRQHPARGPSRAGRADLGGDGRRRRERGRPGRVVAGRRGWGGWRRPTVCSTAGEERFSSRWSPAATCVVVRAIDRHHNRATVGAVEGEEED